MPPPTPSTALARILVGAPSRSNPSQERSKIDLMIFSIVFRCHFWIDWGSNLAVILNPFGGPNQPNCGLRCSSKRELLQKRAFYETFVKTNEFWWFWLQDRAQNDPRQAQDGSKRVLIAFFFDVEFCLRFWSIWDSILSPFWPSKSIPNRSKNK